MEPTLHNSLPNFFSKVKPVLDFFRKRPLITLLTFITVVVSLWFINLERIKYMSFDGLVENVIYERGTFPRVTIGGETYNLGFTDYSFSKSRIDIGDRLVKKKGEFDLRLIKKNSRDTIDFYNK